MRTKNQDITVLVFCFNVYLSSSKNVSKDGSSGTDHPEISTVRVKSPQRHNDSDKQPLCSGKHIKVKATDVDPHLINVSISFIIKIQHNCASVRSLPGTDTEQTADDGPAPQEL